MKHLNQEATRLFLRALPVPDADSIVFTTRQNHFTLTVRRQKHISWPFGYAQFIAFDLQDSKDIQCPEMVFVLSDYRTEENKSEDYVAVYPRVYFAENLDANQVTFDWRGSAFTKYNATAQADQVVFANEWMRTLHEEGLIP